MIVTRNDLRFVAHFDILGFKALSYKDEGMAWGVLSDYQQCIDYIQYNVSLSTKDDKKILIGDRAKFVLFSDTILGFSFSNTIEDFLIFIVSCSQLFADSLHKCVPIRGGICYGNFSFNLDKQLYFGLPFIKAHDIGESAQWFGVIVDDSVYDFYSKFIRKKFDWDVSIMEWGVPQKDGSKKKSWVINWPEVFKRNFTKSFPISSTIFTQLSKGCSVNLKICQNNLNKNI